MVISGCSSGDKSTLLSELGRRGYTTVEEPGRRAVKEEMLGEGLALPWVDEIAFAQRTIALALADLATANRVAGWVFFDRGLIDAAAALQHLTGEPALAIVRQAHRYHPRAFLAPPWPEICVTDPERQRGPDLAIAEYQRLLDVYLSLGYNVTILPKVCVDERVDFILRQRVGSRPFACENELGLFARPPQHFRIAQVVVDDHFRILDAFFGAERDQSEVARPRPDQKALPFCFLSH